MKYSKIFNILFFVGLSTQISFLEAHASEESTQGNQYEVYFIEKFENGVEVGRAEVFNFSTKNNYITAVLSAKGRLYFEKVKYVLTRIYSEKIGPNFETREAKTVGSGTYMVNLNFDNEYFEFIKVEWPGDYEVAFWINESTMIASGRFTVKYSPNIPHGF